jgi:hypothetical protein
MSKIIFDNVKFNTEITDEEKAQLETIPNVLVVSSSNDGNGVSVYKIKSILGEHSLEITDPDVNMVFADAVLKKASVNMFSDAAPKPVARSHGCSKVPSGIAL